MYTELTVKLFPNGYTEGVSRFTATALFAVMNASNPGILAVATRSFNSPWFISPEGLANTFQLRESVGWISLDRIGAGVIGYKISHPVSGKVAILNYPCNLHEGNINAPKLRFL